MAAGITMLTLSFLASLQRGSQKPSIASTGVAAGREEGYRKALAVFVVAWTLAGASDSWILITTEGSDNLRPHLFNIFVLTLMSFRLWTL